MLTINDLKTGTVYKSEGIPYEVLEVHHSHIGRGGSVLETKLRNLKTGAVLQRSFKQADVFAEVEVKKIPVTFIYHHRGVYWFSRTDRPQERFSFIENQIGEHARRFLTPNLICEALEIDSETLGITLPIKVDIEVTEAPPGIKGDTAQGGSKTVKLETGAEISVPLFINAGDIIRVNTESGSYVERVEKARL